MQCAFNYFSFAKRSSPVVGGLTSSPFSASGDSRATLGQLCKAKVQCVNREVSAGQGSEITVAMSLPGGKAMFKCTLPKHPMHYV